MKIRMYRGPMDGKVQFVPPKTVELMTVKAGIPLVWVKEAKGSLEEVIPMQTYRYVKTKATHPDGSVYFEWDKPKGTRT
jgi:hypothetical protein